MIKSIDLKSYGQFHDLKLQFTPGINLIYAENEGGKTTLFSAMETALLGFIPAGQNHPYFPWEGQELSLEMELRDGRRVIRRMRGSITGFIQDGDHLLTLSNKPLDDLSRAYFRSFHLLQAEDLLGLEQNSMDQVLEKHLESLYSGGGTTVQAMLLLLEERRSRIYKKRGSNYKLFELEEDLSKLHQEEQRYAFVEKELKVKKRERRDLEEFIKTQDLSQLQGAVYPKIVEKLDWEHYEEALKVEKKEGALGERKEKFREKLFVFPSAQTKGINPKAYLLEEKKNQIFREELRLQEQLDVLRENIYCQAGYSSLELDQMYRIRPSTYRGTLLSALLLLLIGFFGAILQKPQILSLLLPVLILFYFFFQSWKLQLKEANLPGFFFAPKKVQLLSAQGKQWKIYQEELKKVVESKDALSVEEEALLLEEGGWSSLEEYLQAEKLQEKSHALFQEEESLRREEIEVEKEWAALGELVSLYRPLGMERLKKDLQWKDQSSSFIQERDLSSQRLARLDLEIQRLEKELAKPPGARQTLLNQKEALMEEYNRALFLSSLLEAGYGGYKDELLPKLLRRASQFLRSFTQGSYEAVMSSKEAALFLLKEGQIIPVKESMSKGLRSQLYLALRLALVELVDLEFPMFFDEAFSNWDEGRLESTLYSLQELPRQQFIFCCKGRDRDLFEKILGLKAIHL